MDVTNCDLDVSNRLAVVVSAPIQLIEALLLDYSVVLVSLLYWPGCTTSYLLPNLSDEVSRLLRRLGVDFKSAGKGRCCGYPLALVGDYESFRSLASDVVEFIRAEGAEEVITNCPGCFRCFNEFYPKFLGGIPFKVMHSTHLIYEGIKAGRLKFRDGVKMRVTYHDPCDLGRHSGIYDTPRDILTSIPGVELVEMVRSREGSRCCGAGGVLRLSLPQLSTQIAVTRIKDDVSPLGVDAVVTACPTCVKSLRDGVSISELLYGTKSYEVLDITEFVNMLIERVD